MKIVGYCTLLTIAFALLIAVCAIIKQGHVAPDSGSDSEVATGKLIRPATVRALAPKPASSPALPTV